MNVIEDCPICIKIVETEMEVSFGWSKIESNSEGDNVEKFCCDIIHPTNRKTLWTVLMCPTDILEFDRRSNPEDLYKISDLLSGKDGRSPLSRSSLEEYMNGVMRIPDLRLSKSFCLLIDVHCHHLKDKLTSFRKTSTSEILQNETSQIVIGNLQSKIAELNNENMELLKKLEDSYHKINEWKSRYHLLLKNKSDEHIEEESKEFEISTDIPENPYLQKDLFERMCMKTVNAESPKTIKVSRIERILNSVPISWSMLVNQLKLPTSGIPLRTVTVSFSKYSRVFSGEDIIQWLQDNLLSDQNVLQKRDAIFLGEALFDKKVIIPITSQCKEFVSSAYQFYYLRIGRIPSP